MKCYVTFIFFRRRPREKITKVKMLNVLSKHNTDKIKAVAAPRSQIVVFKVADDITAKQLEAHVRNIIKIELLLEADVYAILCRDLTKIIKEIEEILSKE